MVDCTNIIHVGPFDAQLKGNDILLVILKEDYKDISLSTLVDLTAAIGQIGSGRKLKVIIDIRSFNIISEEAKKYSATAQGQIYTKANAIVIHSLAARLGANFFIRFNKPVTPTRVFNSVEDAEKWLLGIK